MREATLIERYLLLKKHVILFKGRLVVTEAVCLCKKMAEKHLAVQFTHSPLMCERKERKYWS